MRISTITSFLESMAPPVLQESYDNAGLITGSGDWECTGILCSLDATQPVIEEAEKLGCNLVVAHHPIVFGGLKRLNGHNYVEKTVIAAIKKDIAIYAIHTNLDNIMSGVNGRMAQVLGLRDLQILAPKAGTLRKLFTFVPALHAAAVRTALFAAGAGQIGHYGECSFNAEGTGTFTPGPGTRPFTGTAGVPHEEAETKIEVIFPAYLEKMVVKALMEAHPYEEVAYDLVPLANTHPQIGAGMLGELPEPLPAAGFLDLLRQRFRTPFIRHTATDSQMIQKVALCGGAGSFLISNALRAGADAFVTADLKYHEFFDANDRLLLADIGHYESEQFTIDLLQEVLEQKFPNFAVLKTKVETNPVHYYI